MAKYRVGLIELHVTPVLVEADNAAQAVEKARNKQTIDMLNVKIRSHEGFLDEIAEDNGTPLEILLNHLTEEDTKALLDAFPDANEQLFVPGIHSVELA